LTQRIQNARRPSGKSPGTAREIRGRKQADEKLRISEERCRTLAESAQDFIYIVGPDLTLQYMNNAAARPTGKHPAELIGKLVASIFPPGTSDFSLNKLRQVFETGRPLRFDETLSFPGRSAWVNTQLVPIQNERGATMGVMGITRDNTERREAQQALIRSRDELEARVRERTAELAMANEALRKSEATFRSLTESADDQIFLIDLGGTFLYVNPALAEAFGTAANDLINKNFRNFFPEETLRQQSEMIGRTLETGAPHHKELEIVYPASRLWVDAHLIPLMDEAGRATAFAGIIRDITERRRTQEALRLSEDKFKYIFENSTIGKSITLPQGDINVNSAFCEMLGRTPEELKQKTWQAISFPDDIAATQKILDSILSGERESARFEKRYIHKSGNIVWADVTTALRRDTEGKPLYFITSVNDITQRKLAEADLLRNQRELAVRNRIAEVFLTISDEKMFEGVLRIILEVLNSRYGVFGYIDEKGDLIVPTMTRHVWDQCNVPEKDIVFPRENWGNSAWPKAIRDKRTNYSNEPSVGIPKGHIPIDRQISMPLIHKGEVVGLIQVANKESEYTAEDIHLLETMGKAIAPVLDARLQRDRQDRDRRNAEEKLIKTVAELERSNKELGEFAYVASHDLQEPLRTISSYVQLLERRYKDKLDSDASEFIAYAVEGAARMQRLINDLLTYSRVGTRGRPFEAADSGHALGQAIANLQQTIEENEAVVFNEDMPPVHGDEIQLTQLFQNLIENAIKFRGPEKPYIHISAKKIEAGWIFSVRDNGIGIDPQFKERIFQIFQRLHTADKYPGTGIGLAICKRIVERHGGRIWVESEPGKGATFYFTLPEKGEKQ